MDSVWEHQGGQGAPGYRGRRVAIVKLDSGRALVRVVCEAYPTGHISKQRYWIKKRNLWKEYQRV